MKPLVIAASLLLFIVACASPQHVERQPTFEWVGDGVKTQKDLERDAAQCDYEVRRIMAGTPPPSASGFRDSYQPSTALGAAMQQADRAEFAYQMRRRQGENLFFSCLRARGWAVRY